MVHLIYLPLPRMVRQEFNLPRMAITKILPGQPMGALSVSARNEAVVTEYMSCAPTVQGRRKLLKGRGWPIFSRSGRLPGDALKRDYNIILILSVAKLTLLCIINSYMILKALCLILLQNRSLV